MAGRSKVGGLTPKQRKFARSYVENEGDATAAYKEAYESGNMLPQSVHREAHATTKIPQVNAEIQRLLSDNGVELGDILGIHRRNMMQEEHLPTSQRAAESLAEMIGLKSGKNVPTVQVAFVINGSVEPPTSTDVAQ